MNHMVYIVDDDPAVRDGLVTLLTTSDMKCMACETAGEFLAAYDHDRPGCLILDICMPGTSGLDLQEQLPARGISIPIITFSGHGNLQAAVQSMRLGAVDYFEKPFPTDALLTRIRQVLDMDSGMRELSAQREEVRRRLDTLSPREIEVARILVTGRSSKEIARQLDISPRTVEVYRAKIMLKLQADSLCHLVRLMLLAETSSGFQPRIRVP